MNKKFDKKSLSASSKKWLLRQNKDNYANLAKTENYRSRAAYKLLQILAVDNLIKPGQIIADLGAAPGSWSQIAASIVGKQGRVFAFDLLPINYISGVEIVKGDLLNSNDITRFENNITNQYPNVSNKIFDGVLCDLSPNISGIRDYDNVRSLELWQAALMFCTRYLKNVEKIKVNSKGSTGFFICKLFQSNEADEFINICQKMFEKIHIRKPKASRIQSRENYLVAINFIEKNPINNYL